MATKLVVMDPDELESMIRKVILESSHSPPAPVQQEDVLLTSDELAKKLHLSKVTLWKMRKTGRIKGHKLGRRVYYRLSEII